MLLGSSRHAAIGARLVTWRQPGGWGMKSLTASTAPFRPEPDRVSERARRALEFMDTAIDKFGNVGQPSGLTGCRASALYGVFLAGGERDARILVITFDASVHGWAAVLRTAPHEPGIEVVGGFRTAVDLLGSAFISPAALPDCLAAQVYRETLAGWLASPGDPGRV